MKIKLEKGKNEMNLRLLYNYVGRYKTLEGMVSAILSDKEILLLFLQKLGIPDSETFIEGLES